MDNSQRDLGKLLNFIINDITLIFAHRAIKALREEVRKYRQMTNELEEECRSVINYHSSHHQELKKIENEIKVGRP